MIIKDLKNNIHDPSTPINLVLKDLYNKKAEICLVCGRKGLLLGVITLSDIKKAILDGIDPQDQINRVMNRDFVKADEGDSNERLRQLSQVKSKIGTKVFQVPILDSKGKLLALYANTGDDLNIVKSTVLVTGGAGYVGSVLCKKLLERDYKVIVLDKLLFGKKSLKEFANNKDFEIIVGDVANIKDLIMGIKSADFVVHLAGIVGDSASSVNPIDTFSDNHFSTKSLIEILKYYQISRFVFASSCSVYGTSDKLLKETSQLSPLSIYARTKIYAEKEILKMSGGFFSPVILRFGTIYGLSPRMRFDLVVNTMVSKAFFKGKITVDGGEQCRPLLHVDDAAYACINALESPLSSVKGQIFNVGDNRENYKIKEVAMAIKKFLPRTEISYREQNSDKRDYRVSFNKIANRMKFKVKFRLKDGVSQMVQELEKGNFRYYQSAKYSNYLTLIKPSTSKFE